MPGITREAKVHFELYRHLKNAIDHEERGSTLPFETVEPEYNVDGGFADIVVFDSRGPKLVIEAKREDGGKYRRDIDPYSPKVIEQAFGYAGKLGASYFATFNGQMLVLFRTFEHGRHLMERKSRAYQITNLEAFASHLLKAVTQLDAGTLQWDPLDRAFIARLGEFHRRLARELLVSAGKAFAGGTFRADLGEWARDQGWDLDEQELKERFATQAAYLMMNKLVFHKVLDDSGAYEKIPPLVVGSIESVGPDLSSAFNRIVKYVDFEPIYEHDPIFDNIRLSEGASEAVFEFVDELGNYDLSSFDQDVIGRIYETVIPRDERHALGQYYTPPEVIDLIVSLTVRSGKDLVLDPACGTGGFLVSSYNRLRSLKESQNGGPQHAELLNQLYGIDINRFPAHLSAINLTLRSLQDLTRDVHVAVRDFFNVNPGQVSMMVELVTPSGMKEVPLAFPAQFDVVVANPPYIRQELIADKALSRRHLRRVGADLNEQADIYAYFFTHASEFLRNGGRIGFITSNLWLAVRYGEGLQDWMLDHFKVRAIIHPRRRVFEGQLVPTCITLLEECSDQEQRDENLVKFIMVKRSMSISGIQSLVESSPRSWVADSKQDYRIMAIPQRDLVEQKLWHRFLYAPPLYWRVVQHEKLSQLDHVAKIHYGTKTGANEFFLPTERAIEDFGIETEYLRPVLKSPRDLHGISFLASDLNRRLLDVHEVVLEALASNEESNRATEREIRHAEEEFREAQESAPRRLSPQEVRVTALLRSQGLEGLYRYILWGIRRGFYSRPSCSGRQIWFDLDDIPESRLIAPQNIRGRPFFPISDKACAVINVLYHIVPKESEWLTLIAAFLNSSVGKLFFETHGRIQMGGMVRLIKQDVERFPVLDPRKLEDEEADRIVKAFKDLVGTGQHEDEAWEALVKLDRAVLAAFGYEERAEELAEIAKALSSSRQEQKEYEIPVEVERVERVSVPGAFRVRGRRQAALREFSQQ